MQTLAKNYQKIFDKIQSHRDYNDKIRIIAISKFQPIEKILQVYQAGQVIFGENRPQELRDKALQLPREINWHFVGALQSNKAKYIAKYCSTLHSLCSLEVAEILEKKCQQLKKKIKILIQMNLCLEKQKSGLLSYEELQKFLHQILKFNFLQPVGLMTIPDANLSNIEVGKVYAKLRKYQEQIAAEFQLQESFWELSMGMSSDYEVALNEGATMIRLGNILFGERKS